MIQTGPFVWIFIKSGPMQDVQRVPETAKCAGDNGAESFLNGRVGNLLAEVEPNGRTR
jgi:hypothetical protein